MEEVSELSVQRLMTQRGEIVKDHAITLTKLREELMNAGDLEEIKLISGRIDAMLKCIKAERLCYGLPNEITSEGATEALEGLKIIPRRSPFDSQTNLMTV